MVKGVVVGKKNESSRARGCGQAVGNKKRGSQQPSQGQGKWPTASNAQGAHAFKETGVVERNEVVLTQLISVNWRETADPGVEA